jgi:prophage antirepressor-like protein
MEQPEDNQRPLDILQHFIFDNTEYEVDMLWEDGEPLFKATDIGKVLGIKNVHRSIAGYDSTERGIRSMQTLGGIQDVIMLTEVGLYRIINTCRKPIAWPFQKWVASVIREIQKNNKYEVDSLKKELKRTQEMVISEKRLATHEALLQAYHNKHVVYFGRIREMDGKTLVKIGETKDIRATFVERHPIDYGPIELIHAIECQTNSQFEQFLLHHKEIRKYLVKGPVKLNGGKSIEVILVDDDELKSVFRIAKANLYKFNTLQEIDIDGLNERIQKAVTDTVQKVLSGMMENKELKEEKRPEERPKVEEIPVVVVAPQKKKRIREKGTGKCLGCETDITNRAKFCEECILEVQPKKFEVTKDELYDLVHVQKVPYVTIGKKYGVSDNAIRKRCKSLGIEVRKRSKID